MKLTFVEMSNGSFPRCPKCSRLMAQGMGGRGPHYVCFTGCGYLFNPSQELTNDIKRFENWQHDFWHEVCY